MKLYFPAQVSTRYRRRGFWCMVHVLYPLARDRPDASSRRSKDWCPRYPLQSDDIVATDAYARYMRAQSVAALPSYWNYGKPRPDKRSRECDTLGCVDRVGAVSDVSALFAALGCASEQGKIVRKNCLGCRARRRQIWHTTCL